MDIRCIGDTNKVAAAATVAAGAFAAYQLWTVASRWRRARRLANHEKVALLPSEVAPILCKSPATSTITYFESGDLAAVQSFLSMRTDEIVAANPWLAGVLDYDENGAMALFVPPATQGKHFEVLKVPLCENYEALVKSVESALCGTSEDSVGTGAPLWKVALVPDGTEGNFALVVSANHSFLDGHGYYKIYNMLSGSAPVQALSPQRKHDMSQKIIDAMGGEQSLMAASPPGFLFRFIGGVIWNAIFPATKSMGFNISEDWIKEQKANHDESVPFVSTNDVVVSKFCNSLKCDLAIMSINFRGRIEGCNEDDVGNYEDLLSYTPSDYATPSLIRKSIAGPPYRRAGGGKMPTSFEHILGCTYGAITNWATFARELNLPGAHQTQHIPIFDFQQSTPACIFGAMVIFKPKDGEIACCIAGKQELIDEINQSGMVGKPLEKLSF